MIIFRQIFWKHSSCISPGSYSRSGTLGNGSDGGNTVPKHEDPIAHLPAILTL